MATLSPKLRSRQDMVGISMPLSVLTVNGSARALASIFHDGPVWGWSALVASRLF